MAKEVMVVFQDAGVAVRAFWIEESISLNKESRSEESGSSTGAGKGSLGAKQDETTAAGKNTRGRILVADEHLEMIIATTRLDSESVVL